MLYEILYSSSAVTKFDAQGIEALLTQCFENNKNTGITGCMIYKKREFIQVIEGNKEQVITLFEKIKLDNRHTKIKILWQGETPERSFENWLMGFYNFDELNKEEIEGFANILKEGMSTAEKSDFESTASKLFSLLSEDFIDKEQS